MNLQFGASCCQFAGLNKPAQKQPVKNTLAFGQAASTAGHRAAQPTDSFSKSDKPKLQFGASCCR